MASNPFKAFIAYNVPAPTPNFKKPIDAWEADDPTGGQWGTVGLCEPIKDEGLAVDLQGAGRLMAVQFNDRILPGKVRDEALAKEVAKIERVEGRKISKKDYAILRDQVEFALLPKAFIRRSMVMAIFTGGYMLVCTSSQRKADSAVALITEAFGETFKPYPVNTARDPGGVLTQLAAEHSYDREDDISFVTGNSAVLKGEEKRTIRIKDKDISDSDVQAFLKEDYSVTEIGLQMVEEGDAKMAFVVNDSLCFKRIETIGVKPGKAEDFFQFALLCAQSYKVMLPRFIEMCGGPAAAPADEDDEL